MLNRAAVVAAVLPMLLFLPACGDDGESVTIYSGRTENLIGPILDDFTEATGTEVDVKYGDSAELALLISEEGDSSPADVFLSQSPGAVGFLDNRDLLASVDVATLDLVDEQVRAGDGNWVGFSGRQRVLVYNTDEVDPETLPDSVLELAGEQYADQVAVAPANGSFQDFVSAMRAELGDEATLEWLEGLAQNGAREYANNNAIVEAVSRGEVPMGLVNHYYNLRFLEEDPSLPSQNHFFASDDVGSLLIVTAAAVLESSDNKEVAEELVQFLLGEEAQEFFAAETKEFPLAAGVESPDLPPFDPSTAFTIDFDELGGDLEGTIELIQQSGLGR